MIIFIHNERNDKMRKKQICKTPVTHVRQVDQETFGTKLQDFTWFV